MIPIKIVSGAQTGADQGGLDAAIDLNIPYGGYIPAGRRAENGTIPSKYTGLTETKSDGYLVRTRLNAQNSTATVIFTFGPLTGGSLKTRQFCEEYGKPWIHVDLKKNSKVVEFLEWFISIPEDNIVLNVAGNRESKACGIQKATYKFLMNAFGSAAKSSSTIDKL